MTRPGWFAWCGATLVWTGAAVMSFSGLDGLAESCRITPGIAWLLPIVIDVGVAVAAWVWRRGVNPEAAKLAGRLTWSLLVLTIVGNGAHLGMEASQVLPPWWAAALVGAIPPAVAGATAHLLVLLGRSEPATSNAELKVPLPVEGSGTKAATGADGPRASVPVVPKRRGGPDVDLEARALSLLAENPRIGRRKLGDELGLTEHEARELLRGLRADVR